MKTPDDVTDVVMVLFIVNFEHVSYLFLVFLLLTLNKKTFLFQTDEELERLKAEYDEVDQKLKQIKLMEFEKEDKLNVS